MVKINTPLLSEESEVQQEVWQKQCPVEATLPVQESKIERKNRLRRAAARRLKETGVRLTRLPRSPVTKELIAENVKIDHQTGCWVWQRPLTEKGYGLITHLGQEERVHRVVWMLWRGEIPEKIQVCHDCDNPPCCNPEHLFLETNRGNLNDAARKERMHKKLTFEQFQSIKTDTRMAKEIANELGISCDYVHQIRSGKRVKRAVPYRLSF